MKKLYLLKTNRLGEFYVLAKDPTEAENALMEMFEKVDYGFSNYRTVESITFLAENIRSFSGSKKEPFISDSKKQLLIVDEWK